MRKKNGNHQKDIDDLKRQNHHLEAQIRALERAKNSGQFSSAQEVLEATGLNFDPSPSVSQEAEEQNESPSDEPEVIEAGENGYEASGSDNSDNGGVGGGGVQVTRQIQIQQINPQQRLIQVRRIEIEVLNVV